MQYALRGRHSDGRERERQVRERDEQSAHDGVDDPPVIHDHVDRVGEADKQRGVSHRPEALGVGMGRPGHAEPAYDPHHDAHDEEEGRHVVELPLPPEQSPHEDDEGRGDDREDGYVPPAECPIRLRDVRHLLCLGPRTGTRGIPHRPPDPETEGDGQEHEAERPAREQRHVGHLLGDLDLERVDGTEGRPHERGARADGHPHHRRVAEPLREQHERGHEGDDLLLHVLRHAARREGETDDRDREDLAALEPPDEPGHAAPERPRRIEHGERPADEKDEEHDIGAVRHPPRDRNDRLEGADPVGFHLVEGPRHHDAAPRHRIVPPLVLPRRQHVRQRRSRQDRDREQRQRMRKPQPSHPLPQALAKRP